MGEPRPGWGDPRSLQSLTWEDEPAEPNNDMKKNDQRPLNRIRNLVSITVLGALCLAFSRPAVGQTPAVLTDHYTYLPGEPISVMFEAGPGNRKDWIGIYPEGVEPGSVASTLWLYVDNTQDGNTGLKQGMVTFPSGLNLAGSYVAFLLLNDVYTKLAETAFRVIDPGETHVRLSSRIFSPQETLMVGFTNAPGNPKDWIGIYPEGREPGNGNSLLWGYVDGTQTGTTGLSQGSLLFVLGLPNPGKYYAYLLYNDSYTVLAREPFEVRITATGPRVLSLQPANNSEDVSPDLDFLAVITNGVSELVPDSVQLLVNGSKVAHQYRSSGGLIHIAYTTSNLLPSASQGTYSLTYRDNALPPVSYTNSGSFTVVTYQDLKLPAPLHLETFETTPEGSLPAGWRSESYSTVVSEALDLQDLNSRSYADWVVVQEGRFTNTFLSYNAGTPTDDYQRVLTPNPVNVVNGQVVRDLAVGKIVFGNSGYRSGEGQYLVLYSPDFDLSGKTNIYLSYHSLWEQNQDSLGSVEYSVDSGQTWLPVVYMIVTDDVIRDGEGNIDALATFTDLYDDLPLYVDPVTMEQKGGTYGSYIGASVSAELAAFISNRVDNDPQESKRVEYFRLPQADNQSKVRFRIAHAGTDSWYFGLDNFGLYSIASETSEPVALTVSRGANSILISWPAEATGYKLHSTSQLINPNWVEVPGVVNNAVEIPIGTGPAFFRLAK